MRYCFLLFSLLLSRFCCLAQSPFAWQHALGTTLNENEGFAVRPLTGGYMVVGQHYGPTVNALYLVRTSDEGDTLWTKKIHLTGFDTGFGPSGLVQDQQGNLIITGGGAGTLTPGGAGDAFILKLNAQGDTLWTRTFHTNLTDSFLAPVLGNDGNYILFGWIGQVNRVVKISQSGAVLWNVNVDFDPGWAGNIHNVVRVGALGYQVFPVGYLGSTYGLKVVSLAEDGTVGRTSAQVPFFLGTGLRDQQGNVVLYGANQAAKLTAQGDTLWTRTYPLRQNRSYSGRSMVESPDGSYIILAEATRTNPFNTQFGLIHLNHEGQLLHDTIFYRAGDNYPRSVVLAPDGDYVLSGHTNAGLIGGEDMILLKFRRWRTPLSVQSAQPFVERLALYPNPATEQVRVLLPTGVRRGQLRLADLLGREVARQAVGTAKESTVLLGTLPPGVYLLQLLDLDSERTYVSRLLKE